VRLRSHARTNSASGQSVRSNTAGGKGVPFARPFPARGILSANGPFTGTAGSGGASAVRSDRMLSENTEDSALGAGVAIAADFAVASASGDRCRLSGSPFLGSRCIRRHAAIPSHCSPRRAQAVFHSFDWGLKIRPFKVGNPLRAGWCGGKRLRKLSK